MADLLGITRQAVHKWIKANRVPAERCLAIERITYGQITRYMLRPDVFGPPLRKTRKKVVEYEEAAAWGARAATRPPLNKYLWGEGKVKQEEPGSDPARLELINQPLTKEDTMKTRNDCEVRTFIDEQSYSLLRKLAEQRDRSLAETLRQALKTYLYGCLPELGQLQPVLARHNPGPPLEDSG
jgi:DNA-binding transcriptional regulator YdaS (Cro superfamily)